MTKIKNKPTKKLHSEWSKPCKKIATSITEKRDTIMESVCGNQNAYNAGKSSKMNDTCRLSNNEEESTPKQALKRVNSTATLPTSAITKKPKLNGTATKDKIKPPTLEEINELKETRNLFHSNLFRLQIKEMLQEVKLKESYRNYIHTFLDKFKEFLKRTPSMQDKEPGHSLSWIKECDNIKIPIDLNSLKIQQQQQKVFQFQYIKPSSEPFLVGSAATQTLLGPKICADICILMPAECFQKDDYLNLAYDQKRALYLAYVTHHILKCNNEFSDIKEENLQFTYIHNNPLKPVLEITPPTLAGAKLSKHLTIRVLVGCDETTFKLNRFVPWNNNVRSSLLDENADEDAAPFATPTYNANILFDITIHPNHQVLQEIFKNRPNFQDGLLLLKVWLRQRHLDVGFSGVSAHLMAMFIVYLFQQRKLHHNMSSYQVARNVWNQLAFSNWHEPTKGICLCPAAKVTANQPTLEQMHTYYDVVFVDVTGFHNLCSNLTLDMYKRLRFEAKLAVEMLNDMTLNSFQLLFMQKAPLYSQFDHILKIYQPDAVEQILEIHVPPADKCNYAGYTYPQLLKVVSSLLQKGLKDRIQFLLPFEENIGSWSITESPLPGCQHLFLGLILNPEHAFEVLDKGPESIHESADEFRKFWGSKAQLRRFQDGSITESVVWASNNDDLAKRRLVPREIVLHLLQHHFQLDAKDIDYIGGELDIAYRLNKGFKVDNIAGKYKQIQQDNDAETLALQIIRDFDDLCRKLCDLKQLPLEIVSIAGVSPVLRYCDPQPILPIARCIQQQFHAINVQLGVIQLGLSGKWPSELTALRALKTAFYIQIAELLQRKYKLATKVTYGGVMILHHGYCFNFEIAHPKEVGLLKREINEKGVTQYVDCPASIALEKCHYIMPKVAGALKALHQQYASFGGTVMIAKRWLYSQLIDDGLWPDECTELLIAALYLKTKPQCITCSPQTGFIQFLQYLSHTNWKTELCLINFNNTMADTEISELEQKFSTERDSFPHLCIVTSFDLKHYGKIWSTHQKPDTHVLARVVLLARQTLLNIETSLRTPAPFIKPGNLFTPPTDGYDLVIQIKPENVPNSLACEFGSPFVEFTKPNWRLPLAQTDLMKTAVHLLREAYSDFAAFFYNPCGGKEIGVVWKPNVFQSRPFKVTDLNACSLSEDNKSVQVHKVTLIEDFKFILKDFCICIDTVENVKNSTIQQNLKENNNTKKSQGHRYFNREKAEEKKQLCKKYVTENKKADYLKKKKTFHNKCKKQNTKVNNAAKLH